MGGRARRGPAARDRHALGAWYTPPAVADLALSLALPRGPARRRARVLDPACGDGVFLARARAVGVPARNLCGVDVDPEAAAAARARVRGADISARDLFDLAAPAVGWDAVVGNPPYVRQERLPAAAKRRIRARLEADWPHVSAAEWDRALGRGDLAAAVILRALRLVRPGGRVAMVVSSALVDAGYADALWHIVRGIGRVALVLDAPRERWFADAAVNAVIAVIDRECTAGVHSGVRVARLSMSTAAAAARAPSLDQVAEVARVRAAPATEPSQWAAAMRAPDAWFAFAGRAGEALAPLGALAEIRRGVTSGANDLFYLPRARAAELGIETALLAPLLRSPRERAAQTIDVDPDATSHVALVCPPEAEMLARYPAARRYLEERAAAAERPSLRARASWWALPVRPARLFLTKAYARRFVQRLARRGMVADQRVYAVHPRPGVDTELLAAALNATFTAAAIESLGRASMGEGALEWTVADAARLPVLDPRRLSSAAASAARAALRACTRRPVGDIARERARPDRAALDRTIAVAAPGAAAHLPALWSALVESVERRHRRARGEGTPL